MKHIEDRDRGQAALLAELVAMATGVSRNAIFRHLRGEAPVARARQVAMYLAHVSLGYSLTEVGALFGRDKSTVGHAVRQIEDMRDSDGFDQWVEDLERLVTGHSELLKRPSAALIARLFPAAPQGEAKGSWML